MSNMNFERLLAEYQKTIGPVSRETEILQQKEKENRPYEIALAFKAAKYPEPPQAEGIQRHNRYAIGNIVGRKLDWVSKSDIRYLSRFCPSKDSFVLWFYRESIEPDAAWEINLEAILSESAIKGEIATYLHERDIEITTARINLIMTCLVGICREN